MRGLGVTGPVELVIRTSSGHISVSPGRSGSVEIRGTICRRKDGKDQAETRHRVDFLVSHPPIEQNGNIVKIGYATGEDRERDISINYDLAVPPETRLSAGTGSGSISIDGIKGPVEASAGAGAITVTDIEGDVRIAAGAGEIEIQRVRGNVRLSTGTGPIHASTVAGSFRATTGNGSIEASGLTGDKIEAKSISGNVDLRVESKGSVRAKTDSGGIRVEYKENHGPLHLESISGDITVRLPGSVGGEIDARTVYGEIACGPPVTLHGTAARRMRASGEKPARLRLHILTVWGNIQIR